MASHSEYARCSIVVVKVFTQMMQDIMKKSPVTPKQMYEMIMRTKKFRDKLKTSERTVIQFLETEGFAKLDVTLLYKIAKFFNFIPPPTRNWGSNPSPAEIDIGDDVERIRRGRNKMVHRVDCELSEQEFSGFFTEFIQVGRRVDSYLRNPSDAGFEVSIRSYQNCPLDKEMEESFVQALKEIESLKEQFQLTANKKVIHIFYGTAMEELIQHMRKEQPTSEANISFIINGVKDTEEKTILLNSMTDYINQGFVSIQFQEARKGSIVVFASIKNSLLQNAGLMIQEVTLFLQRIFMAGELDVFTDKDCNAIICPVDEDKEEDSSTMVANCGKSSALMLDLKVKPEVFQTDAIFEENIEGFLQHIVTLTNGKQIFPDTDTSVILCPGDHDGVYREDGYNIQNRHENLSKNEHGYFRENDKKYLLTGGSNDDNSCHRINEYIKAQSPKLEYVPSFNEKDSDTVRNNSQSSFQVQNNQKPKFENAEKYCFVSKTKERVELENFINCMGLEKNFPNKIRLIDVMSIKDPITVLKVRDIPWIVLKQIIMANFNSRDKLVHELLDRVQENAPLKEDILKHNSYNNDDFLESLLGEDIDDLRYNPLDILVAIYHCCSPILKQILAQKLFLCKLAVPLCLPIVDPGRFLFSVWALQSIVLDCFGEGKCPLQLTVTKCPCHVVSFLRIGELSTSKSRLVNCVLSDQYHNTFFNKDCPLGTVRRKISNGLIEVAWYMPSEHFTVFKDVVMFVNLRGSGLIHEQEVKFISSISSVVVVMLETKYLLDEKAKQCLRNLHKTVPGVVLAIDAYAENKANIKDNYQNYLNEIKTFQKQTKFCILSKDGKVKSTSEIKTTIRQNILNLLDGQPVNSLIFRLNKSNFEYPAVDMECMATKILAEEIILNIPEECSNFKEKIVPLQGETWQKWSKQCKKLHKNSHMTIQDLDKIRQSMSDERIAQLRICENLGPFMQNYVKTALKLLDVEHKFHLVNWWLKLLLDERSRDVIPKYLVNYQHDWHALRSIKSKKQHDRLEHFRQKLNESEYKLAEASFGFEHIIRELGQMYEAIVESKSEIKFEGNLSSNLTMLAAKMLLCGHPFELMDGDVANVPLTWVKAVLMNLRKIVGDKKLLALSVLGVQSSGKSTLLNTMFGLQFAVSAGRCTRGVFMQLVPVVNSQIPVDYVLVIDTEGLRAPELADQKYSHDNELATFVIGLGDITIVNIKGENTAEVQDVLQIAVHAFLRLKLANKRLNLKQSCIFIHQNVPACDANDKMMQGRQKFLERLDEMTKEAADQENIADIYSFNQVIDFDCEKDVWYLSDLWNGDPPMAPINSGYSKRAEEVKNSILYELTSKRETFLTITDTISRIEDLWNGILKDDFVFSFRNSLELKAYSSMERQYQAITWKLEKFASKFVLSEAKGEFLYCTSQEDLEKAVPRVLKLLSIAISKEVEVLNTELESFVDSSSLKDVMIQWKQNKRNRLNLLSDELIDRSKATILKTKEEIRIEKLKLSSQKSHEMEINQRAQQLATEMRGQKPSENVLKEKFDFMWSSWITNFTSESTEDEVSIQDQINSLVWDKFRSDALYIKSQTEDTSPEISLMHIDEYVSIKRATKRFLSSKFGDTFATNVVEITDEENRLYHSLSCLNGSISQMYISSSHIKIKRSLLGFGFELEDMHVCKKQTVDVTHQILCEIDSLLQTFEAMDVKFKEDFLVQILRVIHDKIENHNTHRKNNLKFDLTREFRNFIVKHVMRYVIIRFTHLNVKINKIHCFQQSDIQTSEMTGNSHSSGTCRNKQHSSQIDKLEGSLHMSDISSNHISIPKRDIEHQWRIHEDCRRQAIEVTNKLFRKIDARLDEYSVQDVRFDISFASEILMIISNEIEEHNLHKIDTYKFNLLPPYRAFIVTHVTPHMTECFVNLNEKYNRKHSPKAQMEEYKGTVWTLFKNVVESKTENVIAAIFFKDAVSKAIVEHVNDLLLIDIQEHVMASFAHEKYSLMKAILVDLANEESFDFIFAYIHDPSEYARHWIRNYTYASIFVEAADNSTVYGRIAQCRIKRIIKQLTDLILETLEICKQKESMGISDWIEMFVQNAKESNVIPFSNELFIHVQNRKVYDLCSYGDIVLKDLNKIEEDLFEFFNGMSQDRVQWKENPIPRIMDKLWGCTAKCMYCAEPCRNTDQDHVSQGFPHKCLQHRPQGIGGFRNIESKHLTVEFCNHLVQTNSMYKLGEETEEFKFYKKYKTDFPEWDISPTSDTSKYWMWIMSTFQNELIKKYRCKLPILPLTWTKITKQEAIDSL